MKTRIKRLISLLCAVTVFASAVLSTDFLSAKVEASGGQEKESLPTDMTEISFRNFDIADMENYQGWAGKEYTGETMDNTLFSGTVIFPKVADAYITYAGGALQEGLNFTVAQDANTQEWYLRLFHSNKALLTEQKVTATTAGVELVGVPLELHISMEYVNNDGKEEENDLKLGIWFGDNLYENKYIYINDYVGATKTGKYLTYNSKKANGGAITLKSADIKLPKGMTEITFRDFGFADGDYTQYPQGQYSGETLDNALFGSKITFPESDKAHLLYGGKVAGGGFGLVPAQNTDDGTWYLRLYDTKSGTTEKMFNEYKFYSDVAGVSLVGTKLKLHFSTEYVNNDNGETKNDLKLGVWFDGKLYDNKYIYIDNYVDHSHSIGTWMAFSINKELTVNIQSINIKLPTDMTEISFRDFELKKPGTSGVFTDGEYTSWNYGEYTGETLDNTLFSGTVTFPQKKEAALVYAGNEGQAGLSLIVAQNDETKEWYLRLGHSNTKFLKTKNITAGTAGVQQLVGVPLELHISMEYVNLDGGTEDNDLKLGVWFGDTLYEDEYIYINDYAGAEKTGHYLHCLPKNETMTLKSADIKLPKNMTEITFRDFGYVDGDISQYPMKQYEGDSLDGTLFSGKIAFPEVENVFLQYGGKEGGAGFNLGTGYDTTKEEWYLRLFNAKKAEDETHFEEVKLYADVAQVEALVGEEIELNLTVEYVDYDGDGAKDDVKLGVWFNSKLYNNNYIYLKDYADATYTIGTWMSFSVPSTTKVVIESVGEINWKPLPTGMKEITFRDFGYVDGNISQYPAKQYEGETLDGTLFGGKITFPEVANVFLQYGGKEGGAGFNLGTAYDEENEEWYLRLFNAKKAEDETHFEEVKLYADVVEVDKLVGEEIELNLTVEYVDYDGDSTKDDVKLGVWFNSKLYNNNYIYLKDYADATYTIGTWMSFSVPSTTKVVIESVGEINWKPLPTGMKEITFRDFGYVDGNISQYPAKQYEGETLDGTLFGGKITFPEVANVFLQYGGKEGGAGFNLGTAYDEENEEWCLRLFNAKKSEDETHFEEVKLYADVAQVEALVGEEIELNLTVEYVDYDGDGAKDDVKLGVWFNGKLYNNNYIYLKDYVNATYTMGTWMSFSVPSTTKVAIESVGDINWKPLPTGMKEITYRDFGYVDGDISQYPTKKYDGDTLDGTLFSGKITFPAVENAFLQYGGKEGGAGFNLGTGYDTTKEEWYLRLFNAKKSEDETHFEEVKLYADVAQVEALVGEEIELNLTVEYVDYDGDGAKDDVKLGVWFNGKLYNNNYIYLKDYVNATYTMGTWMSFSIPKKTKITIKSVGQINWKPLPTGMTEITFRDFGFTDGDYNKYPSGQYEGETLNNTLFSGNITFPEYADAFLQYGGKVAAGGFNLGTAKDDTTGEWYLRLFDTNQDKSGRKFSEYQFYSDIAGVTLVGEELELNISMEYVDHDGGGVKNDVKLGVWFGGKLYNNNYIYLDNYVNTGHSMGTWMAFSIPKTTKVTIKSVGTINWKEIPEGLTEITFRDFGFTDGDYTKYPNGQYEGETLDNTLFTGKITFPKYADAFLQYGGKVAAGGFNIGTAQDATTGEWYLRLFDTNQDKSGRKFSEYQLYSDIAGVPLVGEEVALSLSLQYVDHDGGGVKNDVKLGVWFGGKLYNNNYIYLDNYVNTGHSMGTWMAFSIPKATKITIKSVGEIKWKPLPTGLTEITFRDFGFTDGDYNKYPNGQYEGKTLDNTLFKGKITFPKYANAFLQYGGKVAAGGFNIGTAQDATTGEWYLRLFDTNQDKSGRKFSEYKLYSDVAGVPLVGEELDLMISLQYVDADGKGGKNDVKLGVWFAGKLYNNRYIYLNGFAKTGHSMGTWMAFSIPKATKITIKSVGEINWKPLPTGLTEIGFSDFGITSGVYEAGSKVGEYTGENLRNTLFSGIVKWHPEVGETHFIYGGTTSGGGFDLVNVTDEKTGEHYLRLFYTTPTEDGKKKYTNYYFHSDVAGVTLVGEELDLKISIEYVDNDGGKKENDVRLGIWFGGKLYNNRYIYINNFGATGHILKNNIQIWNRNGASFSVGRISDWLDWSAFGLNANWKKTLLDTDFNLEYTLAGGNPYTGDNTTFPHLAVSVCLVAVALCGCQIIRKGRKEDGQC